MGIPSIHIFVWEWSVLLVHVLLPVSASSLVCVLITLPLTLP